MPVVTERKTDEPTPNVQGLTWPLFIVVGAVVFSVVTLLFWSLYQQHQNYSAALTVALSPEHLDNTAVLVYSRAWDAAVIRTSALFFAYLVLFVDRKSTRLNSSH